MILKSLLAPVILCATSQFVLLPATSSSSQAQSAEKAPAGKKITMVGCILGQNGKFILVTKKHPSVVQLLTSEDLKSDVGHEVKVTGVIENAPTVSDDTESSRGMQSVNPADNKKKDDPATAISEGQLRVIRIKIVSASCDIRSDKKSERSWSRILRL